jgi:hypothetical protein
MMLFFSIVLSGVLLAQTPAAHAQPFAPPVGWTQMPSYMLGESVTWESASQTQGNMIMIARSRSQASISPAAMQRFLTSFFPAIVRAFAGPNAMHSVHFSTEKATICGSPGSVMRVQLPGGNVRNEMIFESSGSSLYVIIYTYTNAPTADHYLRTLCPPSSQDLASIAPPPGWKMKVALHSIAQWWGPNPGDMLIESQGPVMPTLESLFDLQVQTRGSSQQSLMRVSRKSVTQTCGAPAMEANISTNLQGIHSQSDILVVQSATSSYSVMYSTSQQTPDPAVLAAMHAFCPS